MEHEPIWELFQEFWVFIWKLDPDPHQGEKSDPDPHPHQIKLKIPSASNKIQDPDPHQSDTGKSDPDPHQSDTDRNTGMQFYTCLVLLWELYQYQYRAECQCFFVIWYGI